MAAQRTDYNGEYYLPEGLEETVQPGLAAIVSRDTGKTDAILDEIIRQFQNEGYHLSGLRQRVLADCSTGCGIRLQEILSGNFYKITQDLGAGSTSCNIDIGAVEQLALAQCNELDDSVDLVIVNRFGKRESEGGGFCPLIEKAVDLGIPVLTVVKEDWLPAWLAYGGECVSTLRSDKTDVSDWCQRLLPVLVG